MQPDAAARTLSSIADDLRHIRILLCGARPPRVPALLGGELTREELIAWHEAELLSLRRPERVMEPEPTLEDRFNDWLVGRRFVVGEQQSELLSNPRAHLAKCAAKRAPPPVVWQRRNLECLARAATLATDSRQRGDRVSRGDA